MGGLGQAWLACVWHVSRKEEEGTQALKEDRGENTYLPSAFIHLSLSMAAGWTAGSTANNSWPSLPLKLLCNMACNGCVFLLFSPSMCLILGKRPIQLFCGSSHLSFLCAVAEKYLKRHLKSSKQRIVFLMRQGNV